MANTAQPSQRKHHPTAFNRADQMDEQTKGLLGVVVILRAALLAWAAVVIAVDLTGTTPIRGSLAVAALGSLALWSVVFASLLRNRPEALLSPALILGDVIIAAVTAALDPIVYPGAHPQSFASAWPASGAVVVGIVFGTRAGALSGLTIGGIGAISVAVITSGGLSGRVLGALGTVVLLSIAGALAGLVSERLREAELTRARAQIREDVSRKLHDGVLQTLAVIQRRSEDRELVALARDQEAELRGFIATPVTSNAGRSGEAGGSEPLSVLLRRVLRTQENRHAIRCDLVVVDEPASLRPETAEAILGAVGEAVTNAAKHAGVDAVRVFIDSDSRTLECEVRDDGTGFDPTSVAEGIGLARSIRGRIADVGGRVEIRSAPGRGTTVRLSVPL